jgi:hypothetical protein
MFHPYYAIYTYIYCAIYTVCYAHEVIQFWDMENAHICAKRYDFVGRDLLFSFVNGLINCAVKLFINKSVDSYTLNSANLLLELLVVRDGLLHISDNVIISDDLQWMIEFFCPA